MSPESAILKHFVYSSAHSFTKVIMYMTNQLFSFGKYSQSGSFVDYNNAGNLNGGAPANILCDSPPIGIYNSTNNATKISIVSTPSQGGLWISPTNVKASDLMIELISMSPLLKSSSCQSAPPEKKKITSPTGQATIKNCAALLPCSLSHTLPYTWTDVAPAPMCISGVT